MISKIIKLYLTIHQKDKEAVLDFLQDSGMVEIENWQDKDKVPVANLCEQSDYSLAQVKFTLDFLSSYKDEEEKKSWLDKLAGDSIIIELGEIDKRINQFDWRQAVVKVEELERTLNEAKNKISKLKEEEEALMPWQDLDFAFNKLTELKNFKGVLGVINSLKELLFSKELTSAVKQLIIDEVYSTEKEKFFSIIYNQQKEEEVKRIFSKYDFKVVELPRGDNLPGQSLKQIAREKQRAQDKINQIEKMIKKYLKNQKDLKIVFDWLNWQKAKEETFSKAVATNKTLSLLFWIEEDNLARLENGLAQITPDFHLAMLAIGKDEDVPVVIRNRASIRPFESVTAIYGMPGAKELDPTSVLAPFFIIFFALCLTDAGYGILLAVISIAIIKLMKVPRERQGLFRLLIYGGIVTFFIGGLTGGWFGINLDTLPSGLGALKDFLLKIRIIDPVKEPLTMLGVALTLGIVQVMVGLAVNLAHQIKRKKVWDGILGSGLWLYFIASLLFFGLVKAGVLSTSLADVAKYLVLIGVVALILTQGRKKKNPILKLASGVMSLYGLVGYLSDVLSYSRLLALGLATGIIAMVINLVAVLFKDMIPYVGWLVMIAILIGGHIFNLAINALGAFIHSGRLQFVEFFPKFMEGGGRWFKPFKKEAKYVKLI